jgi:hypothetical protein
VTVRRTSIEEWREPEFDPIGDTVQNVRAAQEWLCIELDEASRQYHFEPTASIREKLFAPQLSVQDFGLHSGGGEAEPDVIDDASVALFAASIGSSPETTWGELTKEERRKASAKGAWWFSSNRVEQRGRPVDTDIPLLLYFVFVIEEIIGQKFPRARSFSE